MTGLVRNDPSTPTGKFPVVLRRDGTIPAWPWFVLGARDPHAPAALRAYAQSVEAAGGDVAYVRDVRALADEFEAYRVEHPKHEYGPDDPCVELLRASGSLDTFMSRLYEELRASLAHRSGS